METVEENKEDKENRVAFIDVAVGIIPLVRTWFVPVFVNILLGIPALFVPYLNIGIIAAISVMPRKIAAGEKISRTEVFSSEYTCKRSHLPEYMHLISIIAVCAVGISFLITFLGFGAFSAFSGKCLSGKWIAYAYKFLAFPPIAIALILWTLAPSLMPECEFEPRRAMELSASKMRPNLVVYFAWFVILCAAFGIIGKLIAWLSLSCPVTSWLICSAFTSFCVILAGFFFGHTSPQKQVP